MKKPRPRPERLPRPIPPARLRDVTAGSNISKMLHDTAVETVIGDA